LESPVAITNTHSVGVVRDALIAWTVANNYADDSTLFSMPVVAETYDGLLNDINGFHVRKEHLFDAVVHAAGGPVREGNVGGGTGMICHQFKGGIGTSSRAVEAAGSPWTLGVLVQTNYGMRRTLTVAGVPVGRHITDLMPQARVPDLPPGSGSIIGICATDAPLLPHQLRRLARRLPLGLARVGGQARNSSGDLFLAFSTANPGAAARERVVALDMLPNDAMNPLIEAAIQATEESIVNALVAAETMTGINGNTVHAIPHDRLAALFAGNRAGAT
jgi:L-aminopeptidase/D-esterase-like protein